MRHLITSSLVIFAAGAAFPRTAEAQEIGNWSVESDVALVSDYRYRGVSYSDEKPAMQAEAGIAHENGFHGSVFLSSIAEYGADDDGDGAKTEVDYALGWAFSGSGFDLDVTAAAYTYPDASNVNFVTFPVSLSRSLEAWKLTLGYDYTPAQRDLADEDNAYAWASAVWAPDVWGLSFTGWLGREDGYWAPNGKTDWGLGVFRPVGQASLGVTYVGTNIETDRSAFVLELKVAP